MFISLPAVPTLPLAADRTNVILGTEQFAGLGNVAQLLGSATSEQVALQTRVFTPLSGTGGLLALTLPAGVLTVALFDLVSQDLRWPDLYAAIVVPFLASATGMFAFRQHLLNIPASLADAARMDGCGPLRFLTQVLVPLSGNTSGALDVIQFVSTWDQSLWPLVIMQRDEHSVVQVGVRGLIEVGGQTDWGAVMAGDVVTMLPPLTVFTVLQKQFSRGVALRQDR
ncbi:carbohydrate ABC transporter permease [Deinococcus taeanensis]|uniref:carbohydrate ABC transporter permease n=1 Tax=Deinococcus taeanensis TaxID=2737050 RepID=UPI001CDBEC6C|nr:carbohydrate ABC transporter permease [Deinococcus taeanensis]UBV42964.1 carbohydrate ABC transporter permease [Deinococcus taeanensis]